MEAMAENKMGVVPVRKLLISMSLPAMFSMLVQALYNVVDSMFVAQISEDALTAVSLVYPVQTLLIAVGSGTSVGVNSLISRRLGAKRFEEANNAADHGIFIGLVNWVIFALAGLFFGHAIMNSFTDDAVVRDMGYSYLMIIMTCSFGVFVEFCSSKTIQATGNMLYPMIAQLIGAGTNIILDPIMIFGLLGFPEMGVAGAALATVIGQIFAMIFSLYALLRRQKEVKLSLRSFRPKLSVLKEIYRVGFPSIIMQAIMAVLVACLNAILIAFSKTAVAFLGVYYKLQSFVFMPVCGVTQGAMPIMGYNYGARNKKRLMDTLKLTCIIAAAIMIVGTLIFQFFPRPLLSIFNATDAMYQIGIHALRIMSICFPFAAIGISISTVFQAIGQGLKSMVLSLLRQLILILPIAYFFAQIYGQDAVWYSFVIAELVTAAISIPMVIVSLRGQFRLWKAENQSGVTLV